MFMNKTVIEKKQKLPLSVPAMCIALYFACEPLTFITTVGGMSVLKLVTFPILAVLFVYLFLGKSDLRFNVIHLFAILYLLWSTTTLFFYKTESAMTQLKDLYVAYAFLILATVRPINTREERLIDFAWLFVGIVCVWLVLSSHETVYGDRTVIVVNGSYEDPNQFCSYFILPVLTALKLIGKKSKNLPWKIALMVYLGVILFGILKTGSRGGLLGIGAAVFAYIFFSTKGIIKKFVVVGLIAIVVVALFTVLLPYMPDGVQERLSVEAVAKDKGSGRFDIWKFLVSYSLNGDLKSLLIGHGLLSTETIMRENYFSNGVAHQQLVQCFFDQGLIGVLIFVPMVGACLIRTIRKNKLAFAALCSIIVFSCSLTFYTFKPMINVLIMCVLSFDTKQN